jgi:hypothetical protein
MNNVFKSKINESLGSILPIALIVFILSITITPLPTGSMILFLIGVVFLVFGMSLFTVGSEMSMQALGEKIGASIASSGKVWFIAFISFVIGVIITISEPDLKILADYVSTINSWLLIITISVGVGIFLLFALLRIFLGIKLNIILLVFYVAAFVIPYAFGLPESFLPLAFDSGGVTTGPMTVPFIMSLGAGVSVASAKKGKSSDAFGMTALASIGPIVSVLVLGVAMKIKDVSYQTTPHHTVDTSREAVLVFLEGFGEYALDVFIAIAPILAFTIIFQLFSKVFTKKQLIRVGIGLVYTFAGLVIFLTGANVGFIPTGSEIGAKLASIGGGYILIPASILLGYFIVKAEPAVYVLNHQVEELSAGAISGKTTGLGLSIGVASALGLSAVRILTGLNVMYILIPGYVIAFVLAFIVPPIFVGVAFDSGGVASGAMMSAFALPLVTGACQTLNGGDTSRVMLDAFGCVAFVAMAPIIAIQICGLIYSIKSKRRKKHFISRNETFIEY